MVWCFYPAITTATTQTFIYQIQHVQMRQQIVVFMFVFDKSFIPTWYEVVNSIVIVNENTSAMKILNILLQRLIATIPG